MALHSFEKPLETNRSSVSHSGKCDVKLCYRFKVNSMLLFIYLFGIQIVCTKCLEHLTRAQLFGNHYSICNGLSSYVLGQLLVRQSH